MCAIAECRIALGWKPSDRGPLPSVVQCACASAKEPQDRHWTHAPLDHRHRANSRTLAPSPPISLHGGAVDLRELLLHLGASAPVLGSATRSPACSDGRQLRSDPIPIGALEGSIPRRRMSTRVSSSPWPCSRDSSSRRAMSPRRQGRPLRGVGGIPVLAPRRNSERYVEGCGAERRRSPASGTSTLTSRCRLLRRRQRELRLEP